jgi:hypothetical protein
MKHELIAIALATLTACSTAPVPVAPDITEERLLLNLADNCHLVEKKECKFLNCEGEMIFQVDDSCVVILSKDKRQLDCNE